MACAQRVWASMAGFNFVKKTQAFVWRNTYARRIGWPIYIIVSSPPFLSSNPQSNSHPGRHHNARDAVLAPKTADTTRGMNFHNALVEVALVTQWGDALAGDFVAALLTAVAIAAGSQWCIPFCRQCDLARPLFVLHKRLLAALDVTNTMLTNASCL